MAAAGRICPRCFEPLRECICPDEDDTPDPFSVPFLAPPEPGATA